MLSLAFTLATLVGFGCQLLVITRDYARYDVQTRTEVRMKQAIETPSLSSCFRFGEILDWDSYRRAHPSSRISYEEEVQHDFENLKRDISTQELFDLTPAADGGMGHCYLRPGGRYFRSSWIGSRDCLRSFSVRKFFILEYMCYAFRIRVSDSDSRGVAPRQSQEHFAFSSNHPGLMLQISINTSSGFTRADRLRPVVHSPLFYPLQSIGYAATLRRDYDPVNESALFNYFDMTWYSAYVISLPAPYTTDCMDYATVGFKEGVRECFTDCMTHQTKRAFGKVMFSGILKPEHASPSLGLVSRHLIEAGDTRQTFRQFESNCSRLCRKGNCIDTFTITEANVVAGEASGILFRVEGPNHMFLSTVYTVKISFIDYFIYVSSLLSLWFGFSIAQLTPHRLLRLSSRLKKHLVMQCVKHQQETRRREPQGAWVRVSRVAGPMDGRRVSLWNTRVTQPHFHRL